MSLSEVRGSTGSDGLTEPQRRHVAVFLQQVEEALDEIESISSRPNSEPRLFRIDVNDLPPQFGAAVQPAIRRVRATLKRLVEALGLESNPRSRSRHIQAVVLTTIIQVEDTGSRGLRGYGPIGPVVFDTIDPALADIHKELEGIAARLSPERSSNP